MSVAIGADSVSILTVRFVLYNIRYGTGDSPFSFPWSGYMRRTVKTTHRISAFLKELRPDVVGLVEVDFGTFRMGGRHQAEVIAGELGHYHAYESKYKESRFTRTIPILRKQGNAFLASDAIKDARFHYFDRGIKRLVIELDLERVTIFLVHLSLGAAARHHQLGDLYDMVKGCDRPKIVAGDFNVPFGHREMKLFLAATGLLSANTQSQATFPSWKPKMELDYVLYSSQIHPRGFSVPDVRFSDHLPLVFDFDVEYSNG